MAAQKIMDITVKTGEYQDPQSGMTKGRYQNVGSLMVGDDGRQFIILERWFNPAGIPNPQTAPASSSRCSSQTASSQRQRLNSSRPSRATRRRTAATEADMRIRWPDMQLPPINQRVLVDALTFQMMTTGNDMSTADGSKLCPECSLEVFVMNSWAHGYAHSSVSVSETGDVEALTKMLGKLEIAKAQVVQRILELESEDLSQ